MIEIPGRWDTRRSQSGPWPGPEPPLLGVSPQRSYTLPGFNPGWTIPCLGVESLEHLCSRLYSNRRSPFCVAKIITVKTNNITAKMPTATWPLVYWMTIPAGRTARGISAKFSM